MGVEDGKAMLDAAAVALGVEGMVDEETEETTAAEGKDGAAGDEDSE